VRSEDSRVFVAFPNFVQQELRTRRWRIYTFAAAKRTRKIESDIYSLDA